MKRGTAALSVFAILFFGATVLQAGKPDKYTVSGGGAAWIGYCADAGFEVWEDVTWKAVVKDFYNKDGDFVREQIHWTLEGVVYNAEAPENQLPYKNSVYNETYDDETGEDKTAGLWALITVPGYGSIFMDVGLIIFDADFNIIFEAGKHQWVYANIDALCEHLAP
jgi:hypothetical protein